MEELVNQDDYWSVERIQSPGLDVLSINRIGVWKSQYLINAVLEIIAAKAPVIIKVDEHPSSVIQIASFLDDIWRQIKIWYLN